MRRRSFIQLLLALPAIRQLWPTELAPVELAEPTVAAPLASQVSPGHLVEIYQAGGTVYMTADEAFGPGLVEATSDGKVRPARQDSGCTVVGYCVGVENGRARVVIQ